MSSAIDSKLPSIDLNISNGREYLWAKTKSAFSYLYRNELNNYDWFLKADDDTFVIIDNLRLLLHSHSPQSPVYFGCRFRPYMPQGYMSGGAGYVLSREALRRFVEMALPNREKCSDGADGDEDVEIGKCLESVNVRAGDSRDAIGKHRMLPLNPQDHLVPKDMSSVPDWFHSYIYYPYHQGLNCCSIYPIAYHYVSEREMYLLYYFSNHMQVFRTTPTSLMVNVNGSFVIDYSDEEIITESTNSTT